MIKRVTVVLLVLKLVILFIPYSAHASSDLNYGQGYKPYMYNFKDEPVIVPPAYEHYMTLTGYDMDVGSFNELSDITYSLSGNVYLVDTGNNRVIITDKDFKFLRALDSFTYNGNDMTFNRPTSVAVRKGMIYVADSGNARVVSFSEDTYECIDIFDRPDIAILEDDYRYEPYKISVDNAGRLYIIANGINQGLIQLNENGTFMSFLGAPKVVPKLSEHIWRRIMTKEQRSKLQKFVPTEYNSVFIDNKGFLYVTSESANVPPIARLNSQGENVLRYDISSDKREYPSGDGVYVDERGMNVDSMFIDIIARDDGIYMALDSRYGRIFSYDENGMLLFVIGQRGAIEGSFYSPSAIEYFDNKIVITDRSKNNISIFKSTSFGDSIENAVSLYSNGYYNDAEKAWTKVLQYSSNYDTAYIALARIAIQGGNVEHAIDLLRPLGEKHYYSIAFGEYRSQIARRNFPMFFGLAVLIIIIMIFAPTQISKSKVIKRILSNKLVREIRYGLYTMFHPFDGFWDIKREGRGSITSAAIIAFIALIIYAVRAQFSGYLFMQKPVNEVNVIFESVLVIVPLSLWCVSNWCFTTLMDGEGSFRDVFIATAYALVPYIVLSPVLFLMTHLITLEEAAFFTVLDSFTIMWILGLLFFGMMITHDYSLKKAALTLVITLIGIAAIIFIGLLFSNLIQDIFMFFFNIYKEVSFRFY